MIEPGCETESSVLQGFAGASLSVNEDILIDWGQFFISALMSSSISFCR